MYDFLFKPRFSVMWLVLFIIITSAVRTFTNA